MERTSARRRNNTTFRSFRERVAMQGSWRRAKQRGTRRRTGMLSIGQSLVARRILRTSKLFGAKGESGALVARPLEEIPVLVLSAPLARSLARSLVFCQKILVTLYTRQQELPNSRPLGGIAERNGHRRHEIVTDNGPSQPMHNTTVGCRREIQQPPPLHCRAVMMS